MHGLFSLANAYRTVPFGFFFGYFALWLMASVLYRRSKGKSLIPRRPEQSQFFESYCSGRSNRNYFTKLGGARNGLSVAVTDAALIIQPIFPFNLMFLPEIYDLEYNIPLSNIRTVEDNRSIFGREVALTFIMPDGSQRSIALRLRGMEQFLNAMGQR